MNKKTAIMLLLICGSFANIQADGFTVKYDGKVLSGMDNIIDATETEQFMGDDVMKVKFEVEVIAAPKSLFLDWNVEGVQPGTDNDFCWGNCFTPATYEKPFYEVAYSEARTDFPYVTYSPNGVIGTSTIFYQFSSDNELEAPVGITVNFRYNGNGTGISSVGSRFDIHSDKEWNRVSIYDLSGNQVDAFPATEVGKDLPKGCYILKLTDKEGQSLTRKGVIR